MNNKTLKQIIYHLIAECEAINVRPGNRLYWRRKEFNSMHIKYGEKLWVGKNFYILYPGGVTLGERCALGENTQLFNHAKIRIGADFLSANDLLINNGSHDPVTLAPGASPVVIGDRVWCGARVTILAGVTIGDDVVIGAGSVVVNDIPSNSIAVGVPARVIRRIDRSSVGKIWTWC